MYQGIIINPKPSPAPKLPLLTPEQQKALSREIIVAVSLVLSLKFSGLLPVIMKLVDTHLNNVILALFLYLLFRYFGGFIFVALILLVTSPLFLVIWMQGQQQRYASRKRIA